MKRAGKGCSPEMAERIVGLLLNDSGIGGLLAQQLTPRPSPSVEPTPAPAPVKRGPKTSHKLTPQVIAFLQASRHLPMPEIRREVQTAFGITLSAPSIYKAWKLR